MTEIKLQLKYSGLGEVVFNNMRDRVKAAKDMLENGTGVGSEFTGWVHLPHTFDQTELERILRTAKKIREHCDVLLVIGIGGSYLGTRAVVEALKHPLEIITPFCERNDPVILYAGHHLDERYMAQLMQSLNHVEVCVNVISKSGTTTEPAVAFRKIRQYMENRYGLEGARERIVATTDKSRGALRRLAEEQGYETFVIEDNIGGRYSVLTPVGLLPIAVSGVDIQSLLKGAKAAYEQYLEPDLMKNDCALYAAARNIFLNQGKVIEVLANYDPSLSYVSEWWKQLYGESEGKNHKGLFPASVQFTSDLHSMGQYIQDGPRTMFETVIKVAQGPNDLVIGFDQDNLDGLNFLSENTFREVNQKAFEGTLLAHVAGGTPNLVIEMASMDAFHLGYLLYFFEKACGISGYLLDVNPFDQPGVEAYKKNMFALLGKPGFESLKSELEATLNNGLE